MATVVTFGNNPVGEARALVDILSQWLSEQPQQPSRAAKARFEYSGDDRFPCVVTVTLDDPEAGE